MLYDSNPQVMLIQHNDTNKSTNIFQDQQSQVKDLMGVLWLKKLFVNKKRNWSATITEQENSWNVHALRSPCSMALILPFPGAYLWQRQRLILQDVLASHNSAFKSNPIQIKSHCLNSTCTCCDGNGQFAFCIHFHLLLLGTLERLEIFFFKPEVPILP